jgi:hypothetical protein
MIGRPVAAAAIALALLTGCRAETQSSGTQPAAQQSPSGLEVVALQIRSGQRTHDFTVEVARTSEEQAQGLMFRESLAPEAGMLFPFGVPRPASFWMKNTLIPLDMVFVREDGSIARIAVNTVPHSLEPVAVEEPVAAVLEIAGGRSTELGIHEGDRVGWPGGPAL